jgi:23S rRNA pseudouridine2605 synthase
MTELELHEQRREKWRLTGKALRTIDEARAFLELVGFCLFYPTRPPTLVPSFLGAWCGTDVNLPTPQKAFSDPRVQEATDMMVRLLREHYAYEATLFDENSTFLVTASVFPYFYALVGDRNPKQPPKAGSRAEFSELACDTFAAIQRGGPISKQKLLETLGKGVSTTALDKSLSELWSKLRITRVDYKRDEGAFWDVLYRWAPDAVREGIELSVAEALSALLSKYLDCVVAADQAEIENFLGNFVPLSRVREAVNALLAARELEFARVGNRTLIQITAPKIVTPREKPLRSSSGN